MPKQATSRTETEQSAAESFHNEKCKTTKWMCGGIVCLFIGLVLLITAVGLFNAFELSEYGAAQYKNDCYINIANSNKCTSQTCTDNNVCTQNTYTVKLDDDDTCAEGECIEWDNGCIAMSFTFECTKQAEYEEGEIMPCYSYGEQVDSGCKDAGRLDPNDEWAGQHTTFVILLVFAIILIIVAIVFFVIGGIRCVCRKIEDDILGETNGTGCYWCGDYERCCYGEGTGHATVVNPQGKNLPIKDKQRRKKNEGGRTKKKRDYSDGDDDEQIELR